MRYRILFPMLAYVILACVSASASALLSTHNANAVMGGCTAICESFICPRGAAINLMCQDQQPTCTQNPQNCPCSEYYQNVVRVSQPDGGHGYDQGVDYCGPKLICRCFWDPMFQIFKCYTQQDSCGYGGVYTKCQNPP